MKEIIIDGKKINISEESYEELKNSLTQKKVKYDLNIDNTFVEEGNQTNPDIDIKINQLQLMYIDEEPNTKEIIIYAGNIPKNYKIKILNDDYDQIYTTHGQHEEE